MKKRVYMAALALLLLCVSLPIQTLAAVPKQPMEAFYVNDYADVLSKADEAEMLALGTALEDETGAQVVAVTVTFFDGMDAEEYSYQLFNNWKLGQKDENNGVLFVLSVGDREAYTAVGIGLEDSLSPSVTGKMLDDYGIPHFAQDDFSLGTRAMYTALCNKVASIYGVTLPQSSAQNAGDYAPAGEGTQNAYDYDYAYDGYATANAGGGFMSSIITIVALVVILSIVRSVFRASHIGSGMPGCLFGWILGRSTRPRRPWGWGSGWWGSMHRSPRPPRPPMRGPGGPGFGPTPPRPKPPGGRSTGGFGGFGGGGPRSGGGGRSGGGPRVGGGGKSRGGGSGRKF